jgi:hypothetical protein
MEDLSLMGASNLSTNSKLFQILRAEKPSKTPVITREINLIPIVYFERISQ